MPNALTSASNPPAEPEGPFDLAQVLTDELMVVGHLSSAERMNLRADNVDLDEIFNAFYDQNLSALSLSGGGIRSATFALGIIQAMAAHNLLRSVDYLSTVSGGGYIGSWLSGWIRTEQLKSIEQKACDDTHINFEEYKKAQDGATPEDKKLVQLIDDAVGNIIFGPNSYAAKGVAEVQRQINRNTFTTRDNSNPEASPICHLRQYSNYMTPSVGLTSADTWAFFSIYLRNVFLNWTIFIPLLAAVLLVPRIIFATTLWYKQNPIHWRPLLIVGVIAGSFAITYIVNKLPSKNNGDSKIAFSTDGWVLALGIIPLTVFAFCLTTICYGIAGTEQLPKFDFWIIKFPFGKIWEIDSNWLNFTALTSSIYIAGYIGYGVWRLLWKMLGKNRMLDPATNMRGVICGFVSSVASGALLWLLATLAYKNKSGINGAISQHGPELFVCLAVPVFLVVILFQSALYVGLSSKNSPDEDREWFARFGGWVFIISGGWIAVNAFVLLWPFLIKTVFVVGKIGESTDWNNFVGFLQAAVPVITVLSGVISLVGGFSAKLPIKKDGSNSKAGKILSLAPQIAAVIFLGMIVTALAYGSAFVLSALSKVVMWRWPIWLSADSVEKLNNLTTTKDFLSLNELSSLIVVNETSIGFLAACAVILAGVGIFMAFQINVNTFSLHGAYRDRLIRAYLGASHVNRKPNPFTSFDETDNRQLHRLKSQKPFHVMNATLNLLGGENLAWQSRKAACFTMSPLHCGSWLLNYRRTNQYSRNDTLGKCKHYRYCNRLDGPCSNTVGDGGVEGCQLEGKSLRLGTAMAISGAAANPNMGFYSSPAVTFLMALFNIRLGWWLGNTGARGSVEDLRHVPYYRKTSPSVAVLPLINETLGRTSKDKRYLNVTDGGHFENLAIYEMVRRRCQFIVVSDGAADESFKFSEISNAIEKCRVDLGVEIKFRGPINIPSRSASKQERKLGRRHAIADIIYPAAGDTERRKGLLVYLRPTILGNEPINIKHYADSNPKFPHQSTGDQFFDEKQFEAYRELGFLTFEGILADTPIRTMGALRRHLTSEGTVPPSKNEIQDSVPLKSDEQERVPRLRKWRLRFRRRYRNP